MFLKQNNLVPLCSVEEHEKHAFWSMGLGSHIDVALRLSQLRPIHGRFPERLAIERVYL